MKTELDANFIRRVTSPLRFRRSLSSQEITTLDVKSTAKSDTDVSPEVAQQILISLMVPSVMMVLTFSMSRVALPVIRSDFQIQADMTAWVNTVFMLPFMMLMPVYGRLSDGLGKRRIILACIVIFTLGTGIVAASSNLAGLMIGRGIQGLGASGLMPLGMAFISSIFPKKERGKALGTWSSTGPAVGFISPLIAGFMIENWGWRAAFWPSLLFGVIAVIAVYKWVPAGLSNVQPGFLRSFDWTGVVLLTGGMTSLLFYLSSRPITGVAPLQDWRLLSAAILFMSGFLWWEQHRPNPFVNLGIFKSRMFSLGSFCGGTRMFVMSGIGFLVPLYLVDVRGLSLATIGGILMISPGTMMLITRYGGLLADKWGSRWPAVIGLGVQVSTLFIFWSLPMDTPLWSVGLTLGYYGFGAGLVLAALHRAALGHIEEQQMGMAAGLYSMSRFAGGVVGTAIAGVMLQIYFDQQVPAIEAYQTVFLAMGGMAVIGVAVAFAIREPKV